jgi:hypothetical protein
MARQADAVIGCAALLVPVLGGKRGGCRQIPAPFSAVFPRASTKVAFFFIFMSSYAEMGFWAQKS